MPQLLRKPFGTHGKVHAITPASAGWRYVGFSLYRLRAGETVGDPKLPLLVLPVGILGTVAGARLTRVLSDSLFFLMVNVALLTVSLKLVFDALPAG